MTALAALEKEVAELKRIRVFGETVRTGAERVLANVPPLEREKDAATKVRILLLRSQAALLLPRVSQEAEKDLNAALKLQPGSATTWVELSECLLRRNSFKEACDALDNALRVCPTHTEALCKYSQIQRNRCGESGVTLEQRKAYLEDSVVKARAAVNSNVDDADAWNTLALSLLSKATLEGLTFDGVRKALSAMQQAERKCPEDPDVPFNKAVLESLLGHFGTAAMDYWRAHGLDSDRLKGSRSLAEENAKVLLRVQSRTRASSGIGKRDFKKICTRIEQAQKRYTQSTSAKIVGVVDIVTEPSMQPVTLLVSDETGVFWLLLMHELRSTSFKIGDVIAYPVSTPTEAITHTVTGCPGAETEPIELTLTHAYPNPKSILVNGHPLTPSAHVPLQMSSRLFA
ncbi:Tetratricopeptide repeat [Novymonas esmeraldas]|uniref:Tetratricopeptide repeat n=1 Tax=Novymonas esmeraldas TaxID=1808958 RepID=A0AAW0EQ59_9TRYP